MNNLAPPPLVLKPVKVLSSSQENGVMLLRVFLMIVLKSFFQPASSGEDPLQHLETPLAQFVAKVWDHIHQVSHWSLIMTLMRLKTNFK